jgi:hypothetical protein
MRYTKQEMKRWLGVMAIALSLVGCSAQASLGASASSVRAPGDGSPGGSGAEALAPRESTYDRESREEALTSPPPVPATGELQEPDGASADKPGHARGHHGARAKKAANNGGPGKAKKKKDNGAEVAAVSSDVEDHDRGHGNDVDGVDEDNPGKSKKK